MGDRVAVGSLRVARPLYDFITDEALPGTGINPDSFWSGVDKVITDLTPRRRSISGTASASSAVSTRPTTGSS